MHCMTKKSQSVWKCEGQEVMVTSAAITEWQKSYGGKQDR